MLIAPAAFKNNSVLQPYTGDITVNNIRIGYTAFFYKDEIYAAINISDIMLGDVYKEYPEIISRICGYKKLDDYINRYGYMDHLGAKELSILRECGYDLTGE